MTLPLNYGLSVTLNPVCNPVAAVARTHTEVVSGARSPAVDPTATLFLLMIIHAVLQAFWVSWVPSQDTADVRSWRMWKLGQPVSFAWMPVIPSLSCVFCDKFQMCMRLPGTIMLCKALFPICCTGN